MSFDTLGALVPNFPYERPAYFPLHSAAAAGVSLIITNNGQIMIIAQVKKEPRGGRKSKSEEEKVYLCCSDPTGAILDRSSICTIPLPPFRERRQLMRIFTRRLICSEKVFLFFNFLTNGAQEKEKHLHFPHSTTPPRHFNVQD